MVAEVSPVAAIVGHSFGGAVALAAALADTAGVIPRMGLYEPATATVAAGTLNEGAAEAIRQAVLAGEYEAAMRLNLAQAATVRVVNANLARRLESTPFWLTPVALAPTLLRHRQIHDLTDDRLRAVRARTLLVRGSESHAALQAAVRGAAAAIPGSEVLTLQGQGHQAQTARPPPWPRRSRHSSRLGGETRLRLCDYTGRSPGVLRHG